ncbi:hypothetical protein [Methylobacterium sp. Leaf117]|uniref:hypothetical protein n=1 Tax=Methylobacterium sp. Leaf117 TaxID=1736260 RepID=UPI0006FFBC11|nr:hypothetical protein [Methylobacterium sp. Leaf117]KQP88869.1 hypothetical protein ASF57_23965 [Methylobacterium sp. Leaf117]
MSKGITPTDTSRFVPFADDAAVQTIGGLSIENGTDRIGIHGTVDLTRDASGLVRARALALTLSAIVTALEAVSLPEETADGARSPETVKNPFA